MGRSSTAAAETIAGYGMRSPEGGTEMEELSIELGRLLELLSGV